MPQLTCQAQDVRSLHTFKDVYLIDFVKQPFKSIKDYEHAFNIVLQSSMREYLSNFIVLMPADWPGQYFRRQLVYQKASSPADLSHSYPWAMHVGIVCKIKCKDCDCVYVGQTSCSLKNTSERTRKGHSNIG